MEIRLAHFKSALKYIKQKPQQILDVGCSSGDLSFFLASRYKHATVDAFDINKQEIFNNKKAQAALKIKNINFYTQDLRKFNPKKENKKYDLICCLTTLIFFTKKEHLRIAKVLMNLVDAKKYVYFDLPNKVEEDQSIIPPKYYPRIHSLFGSAATNTGELLTLQELENLLERNNFEIIYKNKARNFIARFAWDLDNVFREKDWNKVRLLLLPILRFLAKIDAWFSNKNGSCFCVLARKKE